MVYVFLALSVHPQVAGTFSQTSTTILPSFTLVFQDLASTAGKLVEKTLIHFDTKRINTCKCRSLTIDNLRPFYRESYFRFPGRKPHRHEHLQNSLPRVLAITRDR